MCNIAGYVGEENATPVLLDMIRKQEGLNGGFFTGLSTHDGSCLRYCKVQGELETLLSETDAESFVGKLGIAHSRTPSGGNGAWAHPFAVERDGAVKMCYVANGSAGLFEDQRARYNVLADQLIAEGFDIPCKLSFSGDKYTRLSSGETVHMSDVMCQLIYKYRQQGKEPAGAMTAAFTEMPSEIVGLVIEEDFSDRIFFSRINKPLFVGFDGRGAYLASSPTAFPQSVKDYQLMPPLASGGIFKDHYEISPYGDFSKEVLPFDQNTVKDAASSILSLLKDRDVGIGDMFREVRKLFPEDALNQTDAIVYLAVMNLLDTRKVTAYDSRRIVRENSAPHTVFCLA